MDGIIQIVEDDLSDESVHELLKIHLAGMHASSPPENVFALDLSGLKRSEITVWTSRIQGVAIGCGALKEIDDVSGELKSMRTHPDHLRQGIGRAILEHILSVARARGYKRLSLETGSGPAFEPALSLYRSYGFEAGGAFGDYKESDFSQFFHLNLD